MNGYNIQDQLNAKNDYWFLKSFFTSLSQDLLKLHSPVNNSKLRVALLCELLYNKKLKKSNLAERGTQAMPGGPSCTHWAGVIVSSHWLAFAHKIAALFPANQTY